MDKIVLLVVDVQTSLVEEHPYKEKEVLANIGQLITVCRDGQIEVIYVRHDDGAGSDLELNTRGWQIYEQIAPEPGEKIFDKRFNSAFHKTGLKDYLDQKEYNTVVLTGMQTDYCIDATCKVGFEFGFDIIIPEDTVTTFDNGLLTAKQLNDYYLHKIWNNRYAKVKSFQEVIDICNSYSAE